MNLSEIFKKPLDIYNYSCPFIRFSLFALMLFILGIMIVSCRQEEKSMDSQKLEAVNETDEASSLPTDGITKYNSA